MFADISDKRIENLILAALCFEPAPLSSFELPDREYLVDRWKEGILEHMSALDISIQSAAKVLQSKIEEEGDLELEQAAEKQRMYHKQRIPVPRKHLEKFKYIQSRKWYNPCNFGTEPDDPKVAEHQST